MLIQFHSHHFLSSLPSTASLHRSPPSRPRPPPPLLRPPTTKRNSAGLRPLLAQAPEDGGADGGPVELPSTTLFSVDDNPTPLQTATSILLTGAISVFLFRALRRRAKRARELRVRSTGVKAARNLKAEALDGLRAVGAAPPEAGAPPSPIQALLGGVAAGVITLILYKFTTTIEASLSRQAISDNFSVHQITITVRTIVNGLCYLATFVFGINSIGLILYSIQLTFSSIMENLSGDSTSGRKDEQLDAMSPAQSSVDNLEARSNEVQDGSDDS